MCESGEEEFQILHDGNTVWVNWRDGSCIGRFGRGGIDIHETAENQEKKGKQCLFCTHRLPTAADWNLFVEKMNSIYQVAVPQEARPQWVKRSLYNEEWR